MLTIGTERDCRMLDSIMPIVEEEAPMIRGTTFSPADCMRKSLTSPPSISFYSLVSSQLLPSTAPVFPSAERVDEGATLQLLESLVTSDSAPSSAQGYLEQLSRIRYPSLTPGNKPSSRLISSTANTMVYIYFKDSMSRLKP